MDPLRTKVAFTALGSRLAIMGLAFVADNLIPDHDAGVFTWVQTSASEEGGVTLTDRFINATLGGLTSWDGQYFLHVADNGYTYENTLAFFPAYPMIVRLLAEVIYWCQVEYGLIRFNSALVLAAVTVNVGAFVSAAVTLHELSRKVLRDEYLAYKSALLFCVNPASVFFTAAYSESLHAAVSFLVMLKVEKGFSFQMATVLALSTAVRSNGLLNLGFVGYKGLRIVAKEIAIHARLKQLQQTEVSTTLANIVGDGCVPAFFTVVGALLPFAAFQWYGFTQFCGLTKIGLDYSDDLQTYAAANAYKMPSSQPSVWCASALPLSYSYVQSHYWNVGFLRYYHPRQLPNFALAAPILALIFWQARRFFCEHHRYYSARLGLCHFGMDPAKRVPSFDYYAVRGLPRECFVYALHAAALAAFCLLCAHVQVSTRILCSSCPIIYWWAAMLTAPPEKTKPIPVYYGSAGANGPAPETLLKLERLENLNCWWNCLVIDEWRGNRVPKDFRWILPYFVGYSVVGTVLFANFLPWT